MTTREGRPSDAPRSPSPRLAASRPPPGWFSGGACGGSGQAGRRGPPLPAPPPRAPRRGPRALAWLPLVLLLVGSAEARAADPAKPAGGAAPVGPSIQGPGATSANPASAEPTDTINRIIQDNEAILSGRGFTYDPAGR